MRASKLWTPTESQARAPTHASSALPLWTSRMISSSKFGSPAWALLPTWIRSEPPESRATAAPYGESMLASVAFSRRMTVTCVAGLPPALFPPLPKHPVQATPQTTARTSAPRAIRRPFAARNPKAPPCLSAEPTPVLDPRPLLSREVLALHIRQQKHRLRVHQKPSDSNRRRPPWTAFGSSIALAAG